VQFSGSDPWALSSGKGKAGGGGSGGGGVGGGVRDLPFSERLLQQSMKAQMRERDGSGRDASDSSGLSALFSDDL
jgi:hypothetical protein